MAVYDHQDQEQLDELKTWWKQYGDRVTWAITAIAVIALAWQGWNGWQRNQSAQAATLYLGIQQAAVQKDPKRARELAGELIDKFPRTAYSAMAGLLSARVQADAGDPKSGLPQLGWTAENAKDPAVRDLARLRMTALLLDMKSYDDAMFTLNKTKPVPSLELRFAEMKGEVLAAQGKIAEARAAYDEVLSKKTESDKKPDTDEAARDGYLDVLQIKRDALGVGK
jgi:predicted negative regulator of RcsB-dependent stress response